MQITAETLAKIAGKSVNDNMRSVAAGLDAYGAQAGLDKPHRLAHYLAQLLHESGAFRYDKEVWGNTPAQQRYDGRKDLGNTPELDGDGKLYMGRTPGQITGKANYTAYRDWARAAGLNPPDFVAKPDSLNSDPWEGLGFIWYWMVGNPTRKSLNSFADANDIETITKRVNGGLNGFPDRINWYIRAALVLLGYSPDAVRFFQRDAQQDGLLPADEPGKPSQVDGDAGPKTRSAMHMALAKLADQTPASALVTPAPVTAKVETAVAVAPKGADRTLMQRLTGGIGILAPVAGAFAGFDRTGQMIMLGIGVAAVVVLLWRGELIASRVKAVIKSFDGSEP